MVSIHPQYITDKTGNKLSVVLAMNEFDQIIKELEELDDIRLFDEASTDNEPPVPIAEAFEMVEKNRNKNRIDGV